MLWCKFFQIGITLARCFSDFSIKASCSLPLAVTGRKKIFLCTFKYTLLFEKFLHLRIMRAQEGVLYHDIALYVLAIYEIIVSRHKLQGKEEKEGKL